MTIYNELIGAFWLVFVVTWVVGARRAKRNVVGGWVWRREIALRLPILLLAVLAVRLSIFGHVWRDARLHAVNGSPMAGLIGVVLCGLGVGLAVLARLHLGRDWGMPMSRKADPELVTSGPYAVVRHPIYTGILLAMLGSAIGQSIAWLVPLVVSVPYFVYSARREERLMTEQFPEQYPAYMKRTKMLLPYLL